MKTSRWLLTMAASGVALVMIAAPESAPPPHADRESTMSELTGVLHPPSKTAIGQHLILDGSNERCYVRGKALAPYKYGTRLFVRGGLHAELFDATSTDWKKPGAPQPPPLMKGWIVYMDVKEARVIKDAFETY